METEQEQPKLTEGFDCKAEERLTEQTVQNGGSGLVSFAKYVSAIFSPLLMPTYCLALGMWLTVINHNPENTRLTVSFVILLITGLIPLAMILGLIKAGYVTDLEIFNRRQRLIPIIATALCYIAATIYLHRMKAPDWMVMIFIGAFVAGVICAVISNWWKISAHGCAAGAMFGLLARFAFSDISVVPILPWLIGAVILGGIIGVSRVALNYHTPGQFIAGEIVGAACIFLATGLPIPFVSEHYMPLY